MSGRTIDVEHAQGEELLHYLNEEFPAFPAATMFGLVWRGLRVRLLRSAVTLGAVTLAIALLGSTFIGDRITAGVVERLSAIEQATERDAEQIEEAGQLRLLLHEAGVSVEGATNTTETIWLNLMVLLLCTVGIANAMLMSVTERFQEIGTMKCLGANDYLILKLFLIESGLLGLTGALGGVVLGVLMGGLAGMYSFGGFAWSAFPWFSLPVLVLVSAAAGIFLSVLGAIYPALVAARMRPVEALRVEE